MLKLHFHFLLQIFIAYFKKYPPSTQQNEIKNHENLHSSFLKNSINPLHPPLNSQLFFLFLFFHSFLFTILKCLQFSTISTFICLERKRKKERLWYECKKCMSMKRTLHEIDGMKEEEVKQHNRDGWSQKGYCYKDAGMEANF